MHWCKRMATLGHCPGTQTFMAWHWPCTQTPQRHVFGKSWSIQTSCHHDFPPILPILLYNAIPYHDPVMLLWQTVYRKEKWPNTPTHDMTNDNLDIFLEIAAITKMLQCSLSLLACQGTSKQQPQMPSDCSQTTQHWLQPPSKTVCSDSTCSKHNTEQPWVWGCTTASCPWQ